MGLLNTIKREKDGVKEATRSFSKKQENYVAKKFGGDRVKNSGATAFAKGDVNLDEQNFLIECKTKTTASDSISIKKEWLEKIDEQCFEMGKKHPILAFDFGDGENYYILNEIVMKKFVEYLDSQE